VRGFWSGLSLAAGTVISCYGVASFLVPNRFIDGGGTGIAMLVANLSGISLSLMLVLVNAPFVVLGYRHISKEFAIKSCLSIVGQSLLLAIVPFPEVTQDHLLGAVFGGFFVGAGAGLAIRGGGVLDGTDVLAVLLSKKLPATVGEVLLVVNFAIFMAGAVFIGVEPTLYSVLTYMAASRTVDFVLHGIEAYQGVTIVSPQHEAIRQAILSELGRGVTAFKAVGGYTAIDQQVLFCVVTRLEFTRLEAIIQTHDPAAFVVIEPVMDIRGGVIKKRVFH
jgi:uncharacterized membrane-anchored protein YitT (DUF2179 family)